MNAFVFCVLTCLLLVTFSYGQSSITPEQIHLAFGRDPTVMTVTWSTMSATESTEARYGIGGLTQTATGTMTKFVDDGQLHHTQYIHRVWMTGLKPGTSYSYVVGSKEGWSGIYNFTTMKDGSDWSPRICLFGDFGLENSQHSLPSMIKEQEEHMYDAIFHVGDFAYDMNSDNGTVGDKFMNMVQPLAANTPYMTAPGNHEEAYNFSHYKNRFTMPGDEDGREMFYSFNIGPAHVISLSTEFYFYLNYGIVQPFRQYFWLEEDLKEANKPENRAKRPWIITMGHRPMYCSNNDLDDCTKIDGIVRTGIPIIHKYGLEKLFYEHGVDLEVWAHEHNYERLWPVYDWKVYNGSYDKPYTNPKAPVHIITGSAGCKERHDGFIKKPADWSAIRSNDYGYTRMHIINGTHLYMEQVSDDKGGAIIDTMWLIKDKHGYGSYGNNGKEDSSKEIQKNKEDVLKFVKSVGKGL